MLIEKLRKLLDSREISVRELTGAYLDRIDKYKGGIRAYLYVDRAGALAAADRAQSRIDAGGQTALTGIPIALSDNIITKDMPTTCASRMLDGFRPPFDATVVNKLREQDAVLLGKLNVDEFGMGTSTQTSYYGRTCNPYDYSRVPGGASGGAAAAVAAGLCAAALGVDSGGGVNLPAAYCGVSGLRPTYGSVSRHGCASYASCYDQAGPVATGSVDAALLLAAISGRCPMDTMTAGFKDMAGGNSAGGSSTANAGITAFTAGGNSASGSSGSSAADSSIASIFGSAGSSGIFGSTGAIGAIKGLKVGFIGELFGAGCDIRILEAVRGALKWFEEAGADISEAGIPTLPYGAAAHYIIACAEVSGNFGRYDGIRYGLRADTAGDYFDIIAKSRGEGFGREVKRQILFGTNALTSGYYDKHYKRAVSVAEAVREQFSAAMQKYDVLIAPSSACVAPAAASEAQPTTANVAPSAAGNAPASASVAPAAANQTGCGYFGEACDNSADMYSVGPALAGLPALTTTCGYLSELSGPGSGSGPQKESRPLPVGFTIIGRRFEDMKLLAVADAYERRFTDRMPAIDDGWKGY